MNKPLLAAAAAPLLAACSVTTDADQRGSAALNCSQARVAAAEYEIVPLVPEGKEEGITIFCSADFRTENNSILPLNGPIQVRYQVYELVPSPGRRPLDPREDPPGAGDPPEGIPQPLMERVPRPGIGFEPLLYGNMAVEKTNQEHQNGDGTISSFKYAGIVTPKSEWCSDSAGIMTYEFWPVCIEALEHDVQAGIAASGAFVKRVYTFKIKNGDQDN